MSAYVVDPTHIDALVSVAMNGPKDRAAQYPGDGWYRPYVADLIEHEDTQLSPENASAVGAALLAECIESVSYRYSPPGREYYYGRGWSTDDEPLPGPIPTPDPEQYEWTDLGRCLTTLEAFCALSGYEYQSCEHPDWTRSGAFMFCHRLTGSLIGALPGYREANSWNVSAERAAEMLGGVRI